VLKLAPELMKISYTNNAYVQAIYKKDIEKNHLNKSGNL
jgi:hypothetical protein